jgi:hypothetical protein
MIPPVGACPNIRKLYDIYIKKQNSSKEPKNNVIMRFLLESMAGLW